MKPIVRATNLGKQYTIGTREAAYDTLRDSIGQIVRAPLRRFRSGNGKRNVDTIWALKDATFDVKPGEVVGIIGSNGAGKSTLLKVLSRITEPTTGRVELYGRVASLLEVGTGFHPELTGRENIYLNGAILGMKKTEIDSKFDRIVDFSELERFLDTPVKRYSSGMYMRLAFAVAAHLEPEILVVDEVLAVGDAQFQKKCLGKMSDVATEGRTVLFVSHNMNAVKTLCKRTIWVDEGEIKTVGETKQVVLDFVRSAAHSLVEQTWEDPSDAPGNERVRIHAARLRSTGDDGGSEIFINTPFQLEFEFWNYSCDGKVNFTMHLFTLEGAYVFATSSKVGPRQRGLIKEVVKVPANFLNDGIYSVNIQVVEDAVSVYMHSQIINFEVHDVEHASGLWFGKWPGVVRPRLEWESQNLIRTESI